jgi:hypothetical protein
VAQQGFCQVLADTATGAGYQDARR